MPELERNPYKRCRDCEQGIRLFRCNTCQHDYERDEAERQRHRENDAYWLDYYDRAERRRPQMYLCVVQIIILLNSGNTLKRRK